MKHQTDIGRAKRHQMRFVFVRHGVAADVDGRCIGHTDVPLSPAGALAVHQLEVGGAVHKMVSSDLARAAETARILSAKMDAAPIFDERLREMNFGEWDGRSWSDIEQSDGARFSVWMERWTTEAAPGGETVQALAHRVASWLDEQLADDQLHGETIVVVAHAGSIRAAICLLTNAPIASMFDIAVEHACATIVDVSERGATVIESNTSAIP